MIDVSQYSFHESSAKDLKLRKLQKGLTAWLNRILRQDNLSVKDLVDELADGHVLGTLISRMSTALPLL